MTISQTCLSSEDHQNAQYDKKVCPVQLYWHSFDFIVTRFSGDIVPGISGAGRVDQEAYSHELISFGFWAGDTNVTDAAFYFYTFPAPADLNSAPLMPTEAHWIEQRGRNEGQYTVAKYYF